MPMITIYCLVRWLFPALLATCLCTPAGAESLEFVTLLQQAERRSFALKISQSDIALRRLDLADARSLYLPDLTLRYDLGYAWTLADGDEVVSIGDTVSANDLSTWQNALSLNASLLLYDFGAREQRIFGAREWVRAAELARAEALQQLRETVLNAYVRGLQAQQRIQSLSKVLARRQQLYRTVERLTVAGTTGRIDLQNAALLLAAALTRLDDARVEQVQALAALTELTGDQYAIGETEFAPLPPVVMDGTPAMVIETLPQVLAYDAELARLRAERSALRRDLLPNISLVGGYRMYGAEPNSPVRSLDELAERDVTLALVARWELFSGGRSRRQLVRIDERSRQVSLKRLQRIAELEREIGGLQQVTAMASDGNGHLDQRQHALVLMAAATARLRSEGLLGQTAALEREIEVLEDILEAELLRLKRQADAIRLRFWQEGMGS